MSSPLRLGTRRSALALAQSGDVARALEVVAGRPVEIKEIVSVGDTSRASLAQIGGTGVFATRLREALIAGDCDLLVHSLKDLPTAPAALLVVAASPMREDARDVVVTKTGVALADLPVGATVGTGSPRRAAQVARANPGVIVQDIRGNIDSRSNRVRAGELDAVILAAAGLNRLRTTDDLSLEPMPLDEWPTAAGQGALAIEVRQNATAEIRASVARLGHFDTELAVEIERTVLAKLEAGCLAPVGVHARIQDRHLTVQAAVYGADPSLTIRGNGREALTDGYIRAQGGDIEALAARRDVLQWGRDVAGRLVDDLFTAGAGEVVRP